MYQDNVARKDLLSDGLKRTTHLVVLAPEGDKYVGCKKWGIPTITAEDKYVGCKKWGIPTITAESVCFAVEPVSFYRRSLQAK